MAVCTKKNKKEELLKEWEITWRIYSKSATKLCMLKNKLLESKQTRDIYAARLVCSEIEQLLSEVLPVVKHRYDKALEHFNKLLKLVEK